MDFHRLVLVEILWCLMLVLFEMHRNERTGLAIFETLNQQI